MASKRRRKMGLTRMDAALDQMSSFGFSRQLVRKTVRNLLKLYGDDGWKLIEEDGYRVLLDVLLDEQETAQTQNLLKDAQDASSEHENTEKELVVAELNEVVVEVPENKECCKDIALDETALKSPSHPGNNHSTDEANLQCSKDSPLPGPASNADHTPVKVPMRRRKPCYGWISDDDDDDDEENYFVALTPAT